LINIYIIEGNRNEAVVSTWTALKLPSTHWTI